MASNITYLPPTAGAITRSDAPEELQVFLTDIVRAAFNVETRPKALERLTARLDAARVAIARTEEIVNLVTRVARTTETCTRDLAALQADLAEQIVRRLGFELQKDQLDLERSMLPDRMRERGELAALEHTLAKARIETELEDLQHARSQRPQVVAGMSETPNLDAERAAAHRARVQAEARRVVEDITAEHVPTNARQPYHAFAACVYLAARLEGASAPDAAARTRNVVEDRIASGAGMPHADRLAHKRRYDQLKGHLDGTATKRESALVLAALENFGMGNGAHGGT